MKLRKVFTLALHLLLVFGFCLLLTAEEDEPKTAKEVEKAYKDADHYYDVALAETMIRLQLVNIVLFPDTEL